MENTAGVQLLLSLDRSIRELKQQIDAEVGFVGGARVEASDRMEANLTGLGFQD
jgi:hypothetical protein